MHWRQALQTGVFDTPNPRCADAPPAQLLHGIRLFNERDYFECHEVLEDIWHQETDPVRFLYQGILQIGVGLHHLRNGNYRGATLLLTDGIQKTSWFTPACMSVNTELLVLQARTCLERLEALGREQISEFDWSIAPRIETISGGCP